MPEIFHELEEGPGVVLAYDAAGAERGNSTRSRKLASHDADARAVLGILADHPHAHRASWGRSGSVSAAIFPSVPPSIPMSGRRRASYATDIHKRGLGQGMNDDSLDRVGEIRGELLMIWGRQDPHVPREGRDKRIHAALEDAGTRSSASR